jgi:hypothetical protein
MANPIQRDREFRANADARRRHREVQKFATYSRQQRRHADFILEFQAVTSEIDAPRSARRKIARNRLKIERAQAKAA